MLGEYLLAAARAHDAAGDRATAQHRVVDAVDVLRQCPQGPLVPALLELAERHAFDGKFDASLETVREAVETCRLLACGDPARKALLAGCLYTLSERLAARLDHAGALRAAEECVALMRTLTADKEALADALRMLASRQRAAGDDRAAGAMLAEAADLYREMSTDDALKLSLARCLKALTDLHVATMDMDGALSAIAESVDTYRGLNDPLLAEEFASALNALSYVQRRTGEVAGALATNLEAVAYFRHSPGSRGLRTELASALSNLSNRYAEVGRVREAREAIDESVGIFRSLGADQDAVLRPYFTAALANRSARYGRGQS